MHTEFQDEELEIAAGTVGPAVLDRGSGPARTVLIRRLEVTDLDAFLALHRKILDTLGHPSCLDERDEAYVSSKVSRSGVILGALAGDDLVGYACLRFSGGRGAAYADAFAHPGHASESVAEMDGAAVDPTYRRTGLYPELLRARERVAAMYAKRNLVGIVSVHNARSMGGLLAAGYRTRALYEDRFGPNLVIHKDLEQPCRVDAEGARLWIRMDDVRGHERALATSRCGCALVNTGRAFEIEYATCMPQP